MITVGLIGYGLSGKFLQSPFFQSNNEFRLKSIVTSQLINKILFPNTLAVADISDLLDDPEITLVSICSPSSTHFEYAIRSLNAGKHVLIEKPISATAAEAAEIFETAQQKGLHVFVYQNRRFDSDFLTVKKVIESGILGKILSYEAHFDRYKPILNQKKWKEVESPANGIIYDLGSHLIDQSISLFGTPIKVLGGVYTQRQNSEIDDAFDIYMDYPDMKVTLKSSLMVKSQGPKYVINGTLGTFTKYGIDIQEDHLVAGFWPGSNGFGKESKEFDGSLSTNISGLEIKGSIETHQGSWHLLFENIANVLLRNSNKFFEDDQIVQQIKIIETIKQKKQ